jgi:hypothetical protein
MREKTTKIVRKKQTAEPEFANMDTGEIINLGHELKHKLRLVHAANQLEAIATQTAARRKLILTAHELLPKAKSLADKGKPRLLAVLTKIINDRNIRFGVK